MNTSIPCSVVTINTFNQQNKSTKACKDEKYISSPGIPTENVFELQSKSKHENLNTFLFLHQQGFLRHFTGIVTTK